jgi:hypothetical protein
LLTGVVIDLSGINRLLTCTCSRSSKILLSWTTLAALAFSHSWRCHRFLHLEVVHP